MTTAYSTCAFPGCDHRPIDGWAMYRVNPKGQPGIWMCKEHSEKPVDPVVELIAATVAK